MTSSTTGSPVVTASPWPVLQLAAQWWPQVHDQFYHWQPSGDRKSMTSSTTGSPMVTASPWPVLPLAAQWWPQVHDQFYHWQPNGDRKSMTSSTTGSPMVTVSSRDRKSMTVSPWPVLPLAAQWGLLAVAVIIGGHWHIMIQWHCIQWSLFTVISNVKILKISDTRKMAVIILKIWIMWLYHRVMSSKNADWMANSVDPDHG